MSSSDATQRSKVTVFTADTGGAGPGPEAVPRPACEAELPRPPRGVQDLCSVPQERAAHSPPTTRRRQARRALYMEPAAPDLRRVPALPSGRAGLPPEMHGQQPSDSAGRVVPRVMARAPRLTTTPPSTASLTRGSGACLRGQSSRHSPAEPRTDRAPGSSPGSCPPSRRLWPGLQLASEAGRIRTV